MTSTQVLPTSRMLTGCLLAAGVIAGARSESLPDPMQPPASILSPQAGESRVVTGAPQLQSVLISPRRRIAIISGQPVRVGDKVGEARVVRITENEVTLLDGQTKRSLKIFPGVEKHPASDHADNRHQER